MSPQAALSEPQKLTATEAFQSALRVAARNADHVDALARFPSEAIDALRYAGAFGWYVPRAYGGAEATVHDIAEATFELSRRCAATGMIFAMHQIQVGSIMRHLGNSVWFASYLRRVAAEQRLIASATSEAGIGGDLRRSIAALTPSGDESQLLQFEKKASTISYCADADDLLTTVRCSPDAEGGDQVLVLTHMAETETRQISDWDALGMRGTCSPGFVVRATCLPEQVLPFPFAVIATETVVPFSHILWSHVWLGLSADAFERAQNFVRAQAHQTPGTTPHSAFRLAQLSVQMAQLRALVRSATDEYANLTDEEGRRTLSTIGYAVRINNLKIAASEAVVEICQGALRVCGFMGYKNRGDYSIGRNLRDAYSASLMISNERLAATNATLLTICREAK